MDLIFPKYIQYETFDEIIKQLNASQGKVNKVDLSNVEFIFPFGLNILLHTFEGLEEIGKITLPRKKKITSYLKRMDFFKNLEETWELPSKLNEEINSSDIGKDENNTTLIEATRIESTTDIFRLLDMIDEKMKRILNRELGYTKQEIELFVNILNELCQNISRHSESHGYVSVQKVPFFNHYQGPLKIAITDTGIGFKNSYNIPLESDEAALKKAILENMSSKVTGGLGIKYIKRHIEEFSGELYIRSGTASYFQLGRNGVHKFDCNLPFFKGSQIDVTLPNKKY